MATLTADRYVTRYDDVATGTHGGTLKAAAKIFKGGLVVRDASGYLIKGSTATTLIPMGVAQETVDNTSGANGDKSATLATGAFEFENSTAGDLIGLTEIGVDVWIVDDQTVAKTNGGATRSRAGKCVGVTSAGKVIVRVAPGL